MTMVSATLIACLLGSRAHSSRGAECRVCRMTVISRWTVSCVDDSHLPDDDDSLRHAFVAFCSEAPLACSTRPRSYRHMACVHVTGEQSDLVTCSDIVAPDRYRRGRFILNIHCAFVFAFSYARKLELSVTTLR